ncbi:MAG TPA: DUF692 domain-containing protein [Burkholderiales bacterium]|nr:DUF692 domain-containing protein [Burkholderiales bacterium]
MLSHTPIANELGAATHDLGVGIGLRAPHYAALLTQGCRIEWLEAHAENYFGEGGYDLHVLSALRERHPISLHGVGLGLGSTRGYSHEHVAKLAALVDRIEPALVSEHLCWGAHDGAVFNELLPLPLTREALRLVGQRVDHLQNVLKRAVLIENITSYVRFRDEDFDEPAFLNALAAQTGCGILLDLNNLYVNQCNHGTEATAVIDAIDAQHVREIHLAGHCRLDDLVIDDHGARVDVAVWTLYARALRRFGRVPTLIEWDNRLPELDVLTSEAERARFYFERTDDRAAVA